jgi:hypothetical protein
MLIRVKGGIIPSFVFITAVYSVAAVVVIVETINNFGAD